MKSFRSMVLISNDPASQAAGAEEIYRTLQAEIRNFGLLEEVKTATFSEVGEQADVPLAIIYPEAVVYGPLTVEDIPTLVEEHLLKGHIVLPLLGKMVEPVGEIAWLRARYGALPVQQRIVLGRVGQVNPESLDDSCMTATWHWERLSLK